MIIGISGSGRKNGITAKAVKSILEESGQEFEFISLSNKIINGCIGCTACAKDNVCKINDDFRELAEKLKKADAIVFGAPSYYGRLNGLSHCFWERTFCFRHNEVFNLAGKLGVIVSTGYDENNIEKVQCEVESFMTSNFMPVIKKVSATGYSQCYTCGCGESCVVGNIVKDHGFIEKVEEHHLPLCFEKQDSTILECKKAGKILGSILKNR